MILDSFNLSGKVAIVTGARTGLGQGMAVGLAEAGADLVIVNRTPMPETEAMIKSLGRGVFDSGRSYFYRSDSRNN